MINIRPANRMTVSISGFNKSKVDISSASNTVSASLIPFFRGEQGIQGPQGPSNNEDPGDFTLIFDNHLI